MTTNASADSPLYLARIAVESASTVLAQAQAAYEQASATDNDSYEALLHARTAFAHAQAAYDKAIGDNW